MCLEVDNGWLAHRDVGTILTVRPYTQIRTVASSYAAPMKNGGVKAVRDKSAEHGTTAPTCQRSE
jgi:hypothetical protein